MINSSDVLKASILIVDDMEANVSVLEQMLESAGYVSVTSTRDPTEVCELHRKNRYDLILLDLQMPGMDGFEVMEGLKEIETGGYLPVLVITGQPDHKLRALKAGAKDFVSKPINLAEVLIRVYNMLEIRLLHRSETIHNYSRLENSQRIARLGDWEYDFADHRLLWSEEIYTILGISRDDFPPKTETFDNLVHPDDLAYVHQEKQTAAEGSHRVDYEHRIIRPDGEVRHFHQITEMTFDEHGKPARESGTMQDVTEQKQAEKELETAHDQFKNIFDNLDTMFFSLDVVSNILLLVSPACEEMYGHPRAAFFKNTYLWLEAIHPDDKARIVEINESQVLRGIPARWECRIVKPNGAIRWVETQVKPTNDISGRPLRIDGISLDITKRKDAEEKLGQSVEQFRLIAENVADLIAVLDVDGKRIYNSPSYKSLLKDPQELVGTDSFEDIHPDDRERMKGVFQDTLRTGIGQRTEFRFLTKDGNLRNIESLGSTIRDEHGKVSKVLVVSRDVTEKKKLEAQFLRAQRMESIGTLAGGIAHDLNNVLAPIILGIAMLKRKVKDEASLRMLLSLESSAQRGSGMVKQVLTFARGISGERLVLQAAHLIMELEKIIQETFPKSVRFGVDVPSDLWTVCADATQIHQVLLNLCVNARDAMPGGGTLTISGENMDMDENYARMNAQAKAGPYIVLTITDTGMGIPPDMLDKIFDPFFTTKDIGKGTGLGLATVHSIVKNHNGFITVYSETGRGTTFRVYLPAETVAGERQSEIEQGELPLGQGECILLVDDEASIRDICRATLESYGYSVLTASDGTDAIVQYAQQRNTIQLVITDMMMPFMDGRATIRALRQINPGVRIIATSGLMAEDKSIYQRDLSISVFLAKPYTAAKLLTAVSEALAKEEAVQIDAHTERVE